MASLIRASCRCFISRALRPSSFSLPARPVRSPLRLFATATPSQPSPSDPNSEPEWMAALDEKEFADEDIVNQNEDKLDLNDPVLAKFSPEVLANLRAIPETLNQAESAYDLERAYEQMKVMPQFEDAGLLDHDAEVGEVVQAKLAQEKKRPPWWFPTHLLPSPREIPKGTRLHFKQKYVHRFNYSGVEPPVNRICRMWVDLAALKLTPAQLDIFSQLMGSRIRDGKVTIVSRERPTYRENELRCVVLLDQALVVTKEILAQVEQPLTADRITQIEADLPAAPIPPTRTDVPETLTLLKKQKIDDAGIKIADDDVESIQRSYGNEVFDELLKEQEEYERQVAEQKLREEEEAKERFRKRAVRVLDKEGGKGKEENVEELDEEMDEELEDAEKAEEANKNKKKTK